MDGILTFLSTQLKKANYCIFHNVCIESVLVYVMPNAFLSASLSYSVLYNMVTPTICRLQECKLAFKKVKNNILFDNMSQFMLWVGVCIAKAYIHSNLSEVR